MIGTEVIQRLSGYYTRAHNLVEKVRGWWTPVWRFSTMSLMDGIIMPKMTLAVTVERGVLWVVVVSKFLSKLKIRGFRKYIFEEGKYVRPEVLASTLALARKELKSPGAGITLSIPRDWAIIRTVELPEAVKANIIDVMGYELDRLTPLSAEDAYYDFRILGEREGRINLLVVAARADLLNQYLNALKEEGVPIDRVSINLSGLAALCASVESAPDSICLQMDPFGYEGAFIHDRRIVSAFGGVFSEQDPEGRAEAVAREIGPSLELAGSLGLVPPVLVSTGGKGDEGLGELLPAPVKALDGKDFGPKLPAVGESISHAAVGTALESLLDGEKGLNLLGKGVEKRARAPRTVSLILVLLLIAAWVPCVILPLQREEKRLGEINRQISMRKDEVKKVEALKKEVEALGKEVASIDGFKETRPMALVLLKELTVNLPKSVWLTRVKTTETTVDIEGYAASASEILPKLEQSKYFKKVEFASPTIRDTKQNADRFVIKMELENVARHGGEKGKDETEE